MTMRTPHLSLSRRAFLGRSALVTGGSARAGAEGILAQNRPCDETSRDAN